MDFSMNTNELMTMLRERYPKDAYAFFTEVPDGTGGNCRRHCDALVMSLWPSRGLTLTGFELKVSRGDWIKELKQPAKADSIARYCDFWYLVVSDEKIVQRGELPATWGLMMPVGGKLKVKTEATKLEAEPISRKFIAGLFRAAQSQITHDAELNRIKMAEYQRGLQNGTERQQYEVDRLKETISEFEKQSGVKLERYNSGQIVEAMRLVQSGQMMTVQAQMAEIRRRAQRVVEIVDAQSKEPASQN